ncbi:hypothetical protein HDU79_001196 [Rhizoclosmatium sp. JEL0117]|nr:hypothetical protein HDU79_001196 [Rhizoclosmatium sp. JEL0117]
MLASSVAVALIAFLLPLSTYAQPNTAKYPQDASWFVCDNSESFTLNAVNLPPMAMGGGQPTIVQLNGWYTATVTAGAKIQMQTTVCSLGGGNPGQPCWGPVSQTQTFDFCTFKGVNCPISKDWMTQNLQLALPGIVPQFNIWGQATVKIFNADGSVVLCFSSNNYYFHM